MTATSVRGWEVRTVETLATVRGGKRLPKGRSLQALPTPHPYIRVTDMHPGGVNTANLRYVPEDVAPSIRSYRIFRDDIFVSVAGTLGIVGRIPAHLHGANLTENADRITAISCDVDYLMYALLSQPIQREIDAIRTVGAQPKLALGRIKQFEIGLPSDRGEQRRVSGALRDVDDLIDALERDIAKKQAVKQGLMQQLLTGRTRLPGFADEWHLVNLGEHVTYLRTIALSRALLDMSSPLRYLHYGDIHTGANVFLDAANEPMPRAAAALAGRAGRLQPGDLVFADASEDPAGVGKSVEISSVPDDGVVAGLHTIAARFDKAVLADGFKAYLQFVPEFCEGLLRLAAGTKVLATTRRSISSITLSLPSVDEQKAIASVLRDADSEVSALYARLEKARALKTGMMQQLLTGRVRLPVEAAS